jgi:hypothetical protein
MRGIGGQAGLSDQGRMATKAGCSFLPPILPATQSFGTIVRCKKIFTRQKNFYSDAQRITQSFREI